jgi:hypothetical protein
MPVEESVRTESDHLIRYANLKLAALGQPPHQRVADPGFLDLAGPLLRTYHEKDKLLSGHLCPADARIQKFLNAGLAESCPESVPRLPASSLTLDRPGLARVLSLPALEDSFLSPYVNSYRVIQGVLHNPKRDRRTTQGTFHIVEGGFPIPADKFAVPRKTFAAMLAAALDPPRDVLTVPFTADQEEHAHSWVSLLIRPLVCPAVGADPAKTMEIRFFAPGSLISNLDFVEAIFGNAGDPYLPENDAALDPLHWTGHTGCVVLAPHLTGLRKKDLHLPPFDRATDRQRADGMCWRDESELYNEGRPFKLTFRGRGGVIVTIIADNYYGHCKKEVKTQIGFAANLFGNCEEEHAGGALAFASYLLGSEFLSGRTVRLEEPPIESAMRLLHDRVHCRPEGYAVDRTYPNVLYVPGNAEFSVPGGYIRWTSHGQQRSLPLRSDCEYVLPSGYRVRMEKQPGGHWQLVGIRSDSTLCHKPCTVSGGGKSEISKSICNNILKGPIFVRDYLRDFDRLQNILAIDLTQIYAGPQPADRVRRPLLSPERSLGSVIKLLTPSDDYTGVYNARLREFPDTMRQLVCVVKQHFRPEWGKNWREHFTVDQVDGVPGHELKLDNQKLIGNYLRVGFGRDGSWRIFKLRPDFNPAEKVQLEDDITASAVVPREQLEYLDPQYANASVKLVANCEAMLFQRPDEAKRRGFDRGAEEDIAGRDVYLSNFEPLSGEQARELIEHVVEFDKFTEPMKAVIRRAVEEPAPAWVVSSAHARLVDGKPSKNPRYLQKRPDLVNPRATYLAEVATRLYRSNPADRPVSFPVNALLPGRRGTPADRALGIPPLAVYNPLHYQELPELLMDFICSLTGKSPSTTGFGSEGALTKRPFNALPPVIDVNNAFVSAALTGYAGFTSAAGHIGPHCKIDHDFSMLVPEIFCRMSAAEREPALLIAKGYLEKVQDFDYNGKRILASRLGYRITARFVACFLARIFEAAPAVLPEEYLRPEKQDPESFAAGMTAIVEAQRQVALEYFGDGSIEAACPPVKAVLHLMAHGSYEGMGADDPRLRAMFTREAVLESGWYRERLAAKQQRDIELWRGHVASLERFDSSHDVEAAARIGLPARLAEARRQLDRVVTPEYLAGLTGTIGADVCLGEVPLS